MLVIVSNVNIVLTVCTDRNWVTFFSEFFFVYVFQRISNVPYRSVEYGCNAFHSVKAEPQHRPLYCRLSQIDMMVWYFPTRSLEVPDFVSHIVNIAMWHLFHDILLSLQLYKKVGSKLNWMYSLTHTSKSMIG